jgi:hypothetical protein
MTIDSRHIGGMPEPTPSVLGDKEVRLTAAEEVELLEALDEAERGDTISVEELFARLLRFRKK